VARARARKSLGQHFLSDPHILGRIADALEARPGDLVLEIGPGRGGLTEQLLARGLQVVAIEKDRGLAAELGMWNAERGTAALTVVPGDALDIDWHGLVNPQSAIINPQWKVVGNIPYNITSPLLDKALLPPLPERVVFLVQSEVADRIAAAPGNRIYGALSVGVQALCRVERLFTVKPGSFSPPPRVTSAVIRLTPLAEPLVEVDEVPALRRFVTGCFSRRRKQLRNVVAGVTGRPAAAVETRLREQGFDPAARPETLAPGEFVRLLRGSAAL